MLIFKKLTEENFSETERFFALELEKQKRHSVRMSDRSPGALLLWGGEYDVCFAVAGDCVIFNYALNENERAYYYPIGKHKRSALRQLREHIAENGGCATVAAVGEGSLPKISREMFVMEAKASRDTADYLYSKAEFENPAGRKHHKRKNLINRFMAEYPDAHFEPLAEDNIGSIYEFYREYCQRNPESSSVEEREYRAVSALLENFNYKYFRGGALVVGGKIVGITIGQVYGDTVYVHFEKAEKEMAGAYQTLSREFIASIKDEGVKYVNREEDLGLEGLRRSKMMYGPQWLEYKYTLTVSAE